MDLISFTQDAQVRNSFEAVAPAALAKLLGHRAADISMQTAGSANMSSCAGAKWCYVDGASMTLRLWDEIKSLRCSRDAKLPR